jgi:hypothetical protein
MRRSIVLAGLALTALIALISVAFAATSYYPADSYQPYRVPRLPWRGTDYSSVQGSGVGVDTHASDYRNAPR